MTFPYQYQILFALVFGVLVHFGLHKENNPNLNYTRGILAAALIAIAHGCLTQSNGQNVRRLEVLWKGASRYTLIYLTALTFIFYQNLPDARQFLRYFYPELEDGPRYLPTYDPVCDFKFFDMRNFDQFYFKYLLGWFVATLIIRDVYFLRFWNLLDLIVQSPQYIIFNRPQVCWEADIILDAICCKGVAINLGMRLIQKLGLKEFDWFGRKGKSSIKEWDIFHNHKRFGSLCFLYLIFTARFLSDFMITSTLWIRDAKAYRDSVWFVLGAMSLIELRDDLETWENEKGKQEPVRNESRWVICGVAILEMAICWKFGAIRKLLEHSQYLFEYLLPWRDIIRGIGEIWKGNWWSFDTLQVSIWIQSAFLLLFYYLYLRFKKDRVAKSEHVPTPTSDTNKDQDNTSEGKNKTVEKTNQKAEIVSQNAQKVVQKTKNKSPNKKAHPVLKIDNEVEPTQNQDRVMKARKNRTRNTPEVSVKDQAPEEDRLRTVPTNIVFKMKI